MKSGQFTEEMGDRIEEERRAEEERERERREEEERRGDYVF